MPKEYKLYRFVDEQGNLLKPGSGVILKERQIAVAKSPEDIAKKAAAELARLGRENEVALAGAYVREADIPIFLEFAAANQVYVGVRRTGSPSVERLAATYACKPHYILEKTLKAKTIEPVEEALIRLEGALKTLFGSTADGAHRLLVELRPPLRLGNEQRAMGDASQKPERLELKKGDLFPGGARANDLLKGEKACSAADEDTARAFLTYALECLERANKDDVKGLVGYWFRLRVEWQSAAKPSPGEDDWKSQAFTLEPTLAGEKPLRLPLDVDVPLGILRVGPRDQAPEPDEARKSRRSGLKIAARFGLPVPFAELDRLKKTPPDAYTGDYDLHCLFKKLTAPASLPALVKDSASPTAAGARQVEGTVARPQTAMKQHGREVGQETAKSDLERLKGETHQSGEHKKRYEVPEVKVHSSWDLDLLTELGSMVYWLGVGLDRTRAEVGGPATWAAPKQVRDRYARLIQHGPQSLYERFLRFANSIDRDGELGRVILKLDDPGTRSGVTDAEIENALKQYEERTEHYLDSLFKVDEDGVIAFTPEREVWLLENDAAVREFYQRKHFEACPWTLGTLEDRMRKEQQRDALTEARLEPHHLRGRP